ncbi:MAG: hypothetical protein KatS3mg002_1354 [Candidatus Woesearchaeota archaeon]|nr:MAG: hypothetical protein KatS3mg002_1354 [Candidatus Woesearchaeota archaeon]
MSTWIKINKSSNNKLVPDGTIGKLIKQTTNYYFIQHWVLNKTIQEKKFNCSILDSMIGQKVTYSNERFPCTVFEVIDYAEDYPSGLNTYSQMTGERVIISPVNKKEAFNKGIEQKIIVKIKDLNQC